MNKDHVKDAVKVLMRSGKGGHPGEDFLAPPIPVATRGERGRGRKKGSYLNLKVSPSSTALPGVISKIPLKG